MINVPLSIGDQEARVDGQWSKEQTVELTRVIIIFNCSKSCMHPTEVIWNEKVVNLKVGLW
jgi:hypothetical protein